MGKVIAIVQQKGGAGKTTVAAHIAVGLRLKNYKILMIDLDSQESLSMWFSLRNTQDDGLKFISLTSWNLSTELMLHKDKYDFIIIDSPPHLDSETKNAIKNADLLIVPMQPSPTDLWATEKILSLIEYNTSHYAILLNRYNPHYKGHKNIADKLENKIVFKNHFSNRIGFGTSMMQGKVVMETEPRSISAQEVSNIIEEVILLFK